MKLLVFVLLALVLATDASPRKKGKHYSSPSYARLIHFFEEVLPNNPFLMKLWEEHLKNYTGKAERAVYRYPIPSFTCHVDTPWSGRPATSVHQLHPGDIKIVAAMGDSLTAGNGIDATNILGDLVEYRGLSWSIGGDGGLSTGELTLPNILRKFRTDLYGYSLEYGPRSNPKSRLNVADPGDTSYDMPGQADMLVSKLKNDPNVDFLNDWKLVTLFVGGNDLCDYCNDQNKYSAANYAGNIRQALDILHRDLPKTFVNVATIFDIAPVAALSTGFFCTFVHSLVCGCGADKGNAGMLKSATEAYQRELEALIASGRYDTRNDFTVVLQPFFKHTEPPQKPGGFGDIDMTFFSPDCFHFSGKGHGAAALSLWNNMLESVGHKQLEWHLDQPFHCPGTHEAHDHWFFTTTRNN